MGKNSKLRRDAKRKSKRKKSNVFRGDVRHKKVRETFEQTWSEVKDPFAGVPVDEKKKILSELGRSGKNKVEEILDSIEALTREYDPLSLIATVSAYGLVGGAGKNGVASVEPMSGINQFQIELLQALILRVPPSDIGGYPATPDKVQEIFDHLKALGQQYSLSRFDGELLERASEKAAVDRIQEMVRGHTQAVRNWGFHKQVKSISKELYLPFDDILTKEYGFSVTDAISVFESLIALIEDKISEKFEMLRNVRLEKTTRRMLRKYFELKGMEKSEIDERSGSIDLKGVSKDHLFSILLSFSDLNISLTYLFQVENVSRRANLNPQVVEKALNYFSLSMGDLSEHKREYFFLENPVWKKMVISTEEGFFCFIPQLFFSFILDIADEMVESVNKRNLHDRRSRYLENKIEEIVKRRFPESKVVSGVEWFLDGVKYETDLVAFIDSHMLIVEAKSQKISRRALRGAPERIKKHLKEILISPSVQSSRLESKIIKIIKDNDDDPILDAFPVDVRKIKKIIRLSISLDDFAMLQANLEKFSATGWVPEGFQMCPSMNLADFETVFDLLEHPVHIIHYLQRRAELEGVVKFFGCELDFLGQYIDTLLNVGDFEFKEDVEVCISGKSEVIDKYYMSKDCGVLIDKPKPRVSKFFNRIFDKLEERSSPRWTEIGCILNRFSPCDQQKVVRAIKDLKPVVEKNWSVEGHKNMILYSPPVASEYSLAVVLFKDKNKRRRYEFFEEATALGVEPDHVNCCLVIGLNIDDNSMPYHYIALADYASLATPISDA